MTNILVSVDFSENAAQVAQCIAEVTQPAGARLILFHVYRSEAPVTGNQEEDTNSERYVQAQLDKLASYLHNTGVSVTRIMKPATGANEALEIATLVKADLAVVCDQILPQEAPFALTLYNGLPVLSVATQYPLSKPILQQHLLEQLNSIGCSASPVQEVF